MSDLDLEQRSQPRSLSTGSLTNAQKKNLTKRSTENSEAYQAHLKGRYY